MSVHPFDFTKNWLQPLDDYLSNNKHELTCDDIFENYRLVREKALHEFVGTSAGFTGLSEFLIFRFLVHLLGDRFVRMPETNRTFYFEDKVSKLIIGHGISAGTRYKPDILVEQDKQLVSVAEIKIDRQGPKAISDARDNLSRLRKKEGDQFRAAMIFFYEPERNDPRSMPTSPVTRQLRELRRLDWLSLLVLEENKKPFKDELSRVLNLGRVVTTKSESSQFSG